MDDHCKSTQGGGISAKSVYRNGYASYKWLNQNVLGVSHVSSFYNQALYIVHIMINREKHFASAEHHLTPLLMLRIGLNFSSFAYTCDSNFQRMDIK